MSKGKDKRALLSATLLAVVNRVETMDPLPSGWTVRPSPIRRVTALPEGHFAVISGGPIVIWDMAAGAAVARLLDGDEWGIASLLLLRDGRLASGGADNKIRIWDLATEAQLCCLDPHPSSDNLVRDWDDRPTGYNIDCVFALAERPDGTLASAHAEGALIVWDLQREESIARSSIGAKDLCGLIALPDGQLMTAGHGERPTPIAVWDPSDWRKVRYFEDCKVRSWARITMLPDGRLASASSDHFIRIWDVDTGKAERAFAGHSERISALAAGPSTTIISCSEDKSIRLWDIPTASEIARLNLDVAATCLAPLPGDRFVIGDNDGRLHLLEVRLG